MICPPAGRRARACRAEGECPPPNPPGTTGTDPAYASASLRLVQGPGRRAIAFGLTSLLYLVVGYS